MLVKVNQLCSCDWKNLFLETLWPTEASAGILPFSPFYFGVCGLEQCSQSQNEKSTKEIQLIFCSAGLFVDAQSRFLSLFLFFCLYSVCVFYVAVVVTPP